MAKYVPDVKTQRWVVIAPGRKARPGESAQPATPQKQICPFCVGSEHMTPPEVYRIGTGEKDGPGWEVRVVPNKFPITDVHEVIIHSPSDTDDVEKLPTQHVTKILQAYRDRYRAHTSDGQVLIFCNHGFHAGASLAHPHSQLVVIPKQINLDTLAREAVSNSIDENAYFRTYCPDFSQWPYETWITPKVEGTNFGDVNDTELPDLAGVLKRALTRIKALFDQGVVKPATPGDPFVYNYYIYHGTNWYLRITPRFIHRAGFELGTGLSVNIVDPTEAAERLKKVSLQNPSQ